MLIHPYKAGHPNELKWTKIFTWRANGDGINPFGNTLIEDCFLRTQDDSLYVNGLGIRRTVLWNDANGSSFVLSSLPQLAGRKMVVCPGRRRRLVGHPLPEHLHRRAQRFG